MEFSTIARPYAKVIFEIAEQEQSHQEWKEILEVGAVVVNDAIMRAFIDSPNIAKMDKFLKIIEVFKLALDKKLNKKEIAFIDLLLKNSRISVLPNILELFNAMVMLSSNAKIFQVISAYKLNAKEREKLINDLSRKYNTTVNINTEIDENLIGGIIIKEGDKVIDLSIQAQIHELNLCLSAAH